MADIAPRINAVPTNIITGFLGVGKTTAILQLVKNKPAGERWAVLVNEFGEIGVDGSLIQGQYSEDNGVFIREVPGGCMCCVAGLPMQVALNQLLAKARPDRLLIEPTGLGHPNEVLQILGNGLYREVLKVQKILTLVNARHLLDERYTDNETYNQQISIADIVVGNKTDLYQPGDRQRLQSYVKQKGNSRATIVFTNNGDAGVSGIKVVDPIPNNTRFIGDSHSADVEAMFEVSIDGGESFEAEPVKRVETQADGSQKEVIVPPEQYTHVRWVAAEELSSKGGKHSYSYRVSVE